MDLSPCWGRLARVDFPPFGFPNGITVLQLVHLHAAPVERFFDCSSPWTHLGCHQLHEMRARYPTVTFVFRPTLVGGIFNSVNPSVCAIPLASRYVPMPMPMPMWMYLGARAFAFRSYEMRKAAPVPAKARYGAADLRGWAEAYGLAIRGPYAAQASACSGSMSMPAASMHGCVVASEGVPAPTSALALARCGFATLPLAHSPLRARTCARRFELAPELRVTPFAVNSFKSLRGAIMAIQHHKLVEYSTLLSPCRAPRTRDGTAWVRLGVAMSTMVWANRDHAQVLVRSAPRVMGREPWGESRDISAAPPPTYFVNGTHMCVGACVHVCVRAYLCAWACMNMRTCGSLPAPMVFVCACVRTRAVACAPACARAGLTECGSRCCGNDRMLRIRVLIIRTRVLLMRIRVLLMRIRVLLMQIRVLISPQ
jgi:hypothetical protein